MFPIAWITLRRITEKAVLIQFGVLLAVLAYLALGLEAIISTDASGIVQSGVFIVWIFLSAFDVFWTTIEIPREISRKEIQVYLSKPITRLQYLLGKFLGTTAMVLTAEAVMLLFFWGLLRFKGERWTGHLSLDLARMGLFLTLLTALCTAASVALAELPAIITVLIASMVAATICVMPVLAWTSFQPLQGRAFAVAYLVAPDLLHYRWEPGEGNARAFAGALAVYTAGWSTVFLLAGHAALRRRDIG